MRGAFRTPSESPVCLRSAHPILKVALRVRLSASIHFSWVRSFELWGRRTEGVVVTNDCGMKCRADCGLLRTGSQEVLPVGSSKVVKIGKRGSACRFRSRVAGDRSVWWMGRRCLESRKGRQGVFRSQCGLEGSFSGVSDPTFGPLSHWMSRVIISMVGNHSWQR